MSHPECSDLSDIVRRHPNLVVLTARISLPDEVRREEPGRPETAESRAAPAQVRQRQRRLNQDQVSELVTNYLHCETVEQLAANWQIHRTAEMSHLRRNGVPKRNVREVTHHQIIEAAQHYEAGASLAQLGSLYRVDPQTVNTALRAAGATIRPRPGSKP